MTYTALRTAKDSLDAWQTSSSTRTWSNLYAAHRQSRDYFKSLKSSLVNLATCCQKELLLFVVCAVCVAVYVGSPQQCCPCYCSESAPAWTLSTCRDLALNASLFLLVALVHIGIGDPVYAPFDTLLYASGYGSCRPLRACSSQTGHPTLHIGKQTLSRSSQIMQTFLRPV